MLDISSMVSEAFGHRYGPAETYLALKGDGQGGSFKEIAEKRKLSERTIQRHLEIAIEVGVAFREANGSITLKDPTKELLLGLIPEDRRQVHGW
jgi:hypothetical protein